MLAHLEDVRDDAVALMMIKFQALSRWYCAMVGVID